MPESHTRAGPGRRPRHIPRAFDRRAAHYRRALEGRFDAATQEEIVAAARSKLELPVDYPTSLAFGGTNRDRLYVTSVSMEFGETKPVAPCAGVLLEITTGLGVTGEVEHRFGVQLRGSEPGSARELRRERA